MQLCSHNHEEIAFEGRKCPFCVAIAEKDEIINGLRDNFVEMEAISKDYHTRWKAAEQEVTRLCKGQLDGER
jgi:hypothetical protein